MPDGHGKRGGSVAFPHSGPYLEEEVARTLEGFQFGHGDRLGVLSQTIQTAAVNARSRLHSPQRPVVEGFFDLGDVALFGVRKHALRIAPLPAGCQWIVTRDRQTVRKP
jgi:hypothetical protein